MSELNIASGTLYHGDNIDFLQGLNPCTVDLFAMDPPFKKNREFGDRKAGESNFDDSWEWDEAEHGKWLTDLGESHERLALMIDGAKAHVDDGNATAAYLCYMAVVFMECHRVLKDTGNITVHCDYTATHWLRLLLDAVFGDRAFRNELIWQRIKGGSRASAHFDRMHDSILVYGKTDASVFNQPFVPFAEEYAEKQYSHEDARGRFMRRTLFGPGAKGDGESVSPWRGIDPRKMGANGSHWATGKRGGVRDFVKKYNLSPDWPDADKYKSVHASLDELDRIGMIHWPRNGGLPALKLYLEVARGRPQNSVITDIAHVTDPIYPTQKPVQLYETLVAAYTHEGGFVADPFAGSGTVGIAAEMLGLEYVLIDLSAGYKRVFEKRRDELRASRPRRLIE